MHSRIWKVLKRIIFIARILLLLLLFAFFLTPLLNHPLSTINDAGLQLARSERIAKDALILQSATTPQAIGELQDTVPLWQQEQTSLAYQAIIEAKLSFTVPHRHDNELMEEVTFEWWSSQNDKKLTICFAEDERNPGAIASEYIRLWGGVHGPMYSGSAELPDTFRLLWQWLWT